MISFKPTTDEQSFIDVAKDIAANKIRSNARKCEKARKVDEKLLNEISNLGFLSLELPESWEGLQLPLITQVQIWQALSYGDLDIIQGLPKTSDAMSLIRLLPENKVLNRIKNDLLTEEKTVTLLDTFMMDEWENDVQVIKKEKGYAIRGTSQPIRLAHYSQHIILFAKDSTGEKIILLVDQSHQWNVEEGDYRLGLLTAGIARFTFDDTFVESANVIAKGQEAEEMIVTARSRIQILQAAKESGLMKGVLDYVTEYTASRKAFGQEIAKFQGVSFRVAKVAIETRIASHLVWEAALKADKNNSEAIGLAKRALYRAHRSLRFVTDSAVQLLGGHGYVQEFPAEKWMRDAQAQVLLYGRENEYLLQRGEQLVNGVKEVVFQ